MSKSGVERRAGDGRPRRVAGLGAVGRAGGGRARRVAGLGAVGRAGGGRARRVAGLGAVGRAGGAAWPRLAGLRAERGQSSVELIALLPLALVIGLAVMSLLAARSAAGQAAAAAQAGAMALIQEADPDKAARAALPPPARGRSEIDVRGRRVEVTVRPPARLPFLDGALAATVAADAGPEPSP